MSVSYLFKPKSVIRPTQGDFIYTFASFHAITASLLVSCSTLHLDVARYAFNEVYNNTLETYTVLT